MIPSTHGLVISAPRSSSGKTTVMLGLLRALSRRGVSVAGAKNGPDYIDPAFHAVACGRESLNLDSWAMPPDFLAGLAAQAASSADLVLCEGSMGLFDGVPAPAGRSGSTADVAAATGWPVVLVVDVAGQSQSAAAVVHGCATYDPRIRLAGVVVNRSGSERHTRLVTGAIEALGHRIFGAIPRSDAVRLPERHLGLVQASETSGLDALLDAMADLVEAHLDLDAIMAAAAPFTPHALPSTESAPPPPGQRIALARDEAFSFVYPHIVAGWRARGAEIVPFSPLADEAPDPSCDICWLPGGYPELHAGRIASARRFLEGLREFAGTRPVHGECGGYMTLGRTLTDANGAAHEMAGLLGLSTSFAKRRMNLGYRDVELIEASCLGPAGARLRGHEFHYSSIVDAGGDAPFAMARDAYGSAPAPSGSRRGLVSGSFFHLIACVTDDAAGGASGDGPARA
ncbi:cobyrinate a,c-diamide synthase [Alsobacter sp. SYSU M60028]|uniref:Hydrogenobyrinate a,c-diamide synthase n=1 Tax=Alsobacter ponti TaxID=2962936 RepID=A0ABT1LFU8_9HYPH|nr:cobyrinate a,c-diamide synthase [Alsobacter ponti]MCP8939831.1 cobyrinate a,c-diamide synthase [Alsobacter ponti]